MSDLPPGPEEITPLAEEILRKRLRIRSGETVTIECWTNALPWADAFMRGARRLGAHPLVLYESEPAFWDLVRHGAPRNALTLGRHERGALEGTDAWVYLPGPAWNLSSSAESEAYHRILNHWDDEWFRVAQSRGIRACRVELAAATEAAATLYGVDLRKWRRERFEGSRVAPESIRRTARAAVRRLERGRRVSIAHDNGTHLELGLRGCDPVVQDGAFHPEARGSPSSLMTVIPAGVLITAVDEKVAEGVFVSNRPSRHHRGAFHGARWTFRSGRLVQYESAEGSEIFETAYREGGRSRDRPGLFSLGLNPSIRDAPLFEDYEQGLVTLYIGRNVDFGGRTGGEYREYALLEGADVTVDDHPLLSHGEFVD